VARSLEADRHLTRFDRTLGKALQLEREDDPWTRDLFLAITQLGSVPAMTALALFGALGLLVNGRRLLALVWVIAPAGGGLLDAGLKVFFERPRPEFRDPAISETTMSFPSGHSMGSLIGYGMLAYLLVLALPRWWARVAVVGGLAGLVLAIGFSRIYLGAHYFSDVLGGYAVGGFWLAACLSGIETARRRRGQSAQTSSPAPNEGAPSA
jgi:undecaprenyl-diphosphatase